nr:hypothetical protein [Pandoravirus belohorizontensis]
MASASRPALCARRIVARDAASAAACSRSATAAARISGTRALCAAKTSRRAAIAASSWASASASGVDGSLGSGGVLRFLLAAEDAPLGGGRVRPVPAAAPAAPVAIPIVVVAVVVVCTHARPPPSRRSRPKGAASFGTCVRGFFFQPVGAAHPLVGTASIGPALPVGGARSFLSFCVCALQDRSRDGRCDGDRDNRNAVKIGARVRA